MSAALDDSAMVENHDDISILDRRPSTVDRRQSMGDGRWAITNTVRPTIKASIPRYAS